MSYKKGMITLFSILFIYVISSVLVVLEVIPLKIYLINIICVIEALFLLILKGR